MSLNACVVALYDGYLYLTTTDGTPVIDVVSGKVVTENIAMYPTGQIGKWTTYSDGALSPHSRRVKPGS